MEILKQYFLCICFIGILAPVISKMCNPFKCFSIMTSLFELSKNIDEHTCRRKLENIEKCVAECAIGFDGTSYLSELQNVKDGIDYVKSEICENNSGNDAEYQCLLDKHKFNLLACFFDKYSQKQFDPNSKNEFFTCSKLYSAEHCTNVSTQCTSNSKEKITAVISNFLTPWRNYYCESFSYSEILALDMKSRDDIFDYYKLGKCLDKNSSFIMSCIPEKWTSTNVVENQHFNEKLCSAVKSFSECVQNHIEAKCNYVQRAFSEVESLLYKYIFPVCLNTKLTKELTAVNDSGTTLQNKISTNSSIENLTETFTDENQISDAETVHVHQHIVVEHRYYNSAFNLFINVRTLIVLAMFPKFIFDVNMLFK